MPLIKIADMPFFIIYLATDVIEIEKKKEYFFYTQPTIFPIVQYKT